MCFWPECFHLNLSLVKIDWKSFVKKIIHVAIPMIKISIHVAIVHFFNSYRFNWIPSLMMSIKYNGRWSSLNGRTLWVEVYNSTVNCPWKIALMKDFIFSVLKFPYNNTIQNWVLWTKGCYFKFYNWKENEYNFKNSVDLVELLICRINLTDKYNINYSLKLIFPFEIDWSSLIYIFKHLTTRWLRIASS